jgi:hypothetical protein
MVSMERRPRDGRAAVLRQRTTAWAQIALACLVFAFVCAPALAQPAFERSSVSSAPSKLPAVPKSCPYVLRWNTYTGPVFNSKAAKKAISLSANAPHKRTVTLQPRPRKGYVGCVLMGDMALKGTAVCRPGGADPQPWPRFVITNVIRGAFCTLRDEDDQFTNADHTDKVIFAVRRRR